MEIKQAIKWTGDLLTVGHSFNHNSVFQKVTALEVGKSCAVIEIAGGESWGSSDLRDFTRIDGAPSVFTGRDRMEVRRGPGPVEALVVGYVDRGRDFWGRRNEGEVVFAGKIDGKGKIHYG